ncbi:protein lin-28 homolog A-like [Puntigrus tetrazona]|uniref:protein lin-28 homolog A-like n=1 Tax=Puntigrus tetrazona TaxID=1606681 RepID=UPI001C8A7164|nr:protein lin-28 homolog A-like [Puntigrus tetrazona]
MEQDDGEPAAFGRCCHCNPGVFQAGVIRQTCLVQNYLLVLFPISSGSRSMACDFSADAQLLSTISGNLLVVTALVCGRIVALNACCLVVVASWGISRAHADPRSLCTHRQQTIGYISNTSTQHHGLFSLDRTGGPRKGVGSPQILAGSGYCKWFNVRMGFGFISMTSSEGKPVDPPLDVFVHQSKLHMEGFRSLKEGEAVEFTFKKSSKGLESLRVTGPGGAHCLGSERRPKGKSIQKRRAKGDRCYNCGGLDHHAKECKLPPQPKRCHFCQSVAHMVANCPAKAQQSSQGFQEKSGGFKEEKSEHSHSPPPAGSAD